MKKKLKELDFAMYIKWDGSESHLMGEEPTDFIYETEGTIERYSDDNDDDNSQVIGKFRVYYLDLERAINKETSVFDIFDGYQQTVEYSSLLELDDSEMFSRIKLKRP